MALRVPTRPGKMGQDGCPPLEAVRGTAGWRRAGVIPTAGAGRRSRRRLRGTPAQAKEGQEAAFPSSGRTAENRQVDPSHPLAEKRGCFRTQGWAGRNHGEPQVCTQAGRRRAGAAPQAQGPPQARIFLVTPRAQGQRAGDCGSVPEAGREPAELGEEPPSPGAEHAAPACSARVHRAGRGGDRAEAVAPGRCLGPDRLHVSPARGHVHRLSPVRRPDVLRINKMKLGEAGGQIAPGSQSPRPGHSTSPPDSSSAAAPKPGRSPRGKLQPWRAPALPRPLRPGGALPQSLIKKVAKLTLPKVVAACAPLSLPALYSLKHD
ncbi:translation initiation factor IF-2-like [Cebus imitator]|uniref:translation initiation factor IF-2-like n=1 Tax=Cebus imitator TaxID=2715852 RepID=UPI00189A26EE|nr:translation initiation factor IF-2-like [Cebus imitator]